MTRIEDSRAAVDESLVDFEQLPRNGTGEKRNGPEGPLDRSDRGGRR